MVLLMVCVISTFGTQQQRLTSTEGSEYWLTFMNNNQALSSDGSLDLEIIITSTHPVTVKAELNDGTVLGQLQVAQSGGWDTLKIGPQYIGSVYLEQMLNSAVDAGVRVYSTDGVTPFGCYAYNRMGLVGSSSRDATLLFPVSALGTEYVVQTFREESMSTEFAVVATEDNTNVYINAF